MRIRANFLVLALTVLGAVTYSQSLDEELHKTGYWWENQTRYFKLGYALGFVDGSEDLRAHITEACLRYTNLSIRTESTAFVCESNPAVNVLKPPTSASYGQLVDAVDHFYADYRNKFVEIIPAMTYAYMKLSGFSQDVLDNYARALRQYPKDTENEAHRLTSSSRPGPRIPATAAGR